MQPNDSPKTYSQVTEDPWQDMKSFTAARIALGRCGVAPPLSSTLDFKLSHAKARDAVHCEFKQAELVEALNAVYPTIALQSAAADRKEYLTRPDLGRCLSEASSERLNSLESSADGYDLCLVIGDGLSARAIHENALPFVEDFIKQLHGIGLSVAPITVVSNARVAIGDPITEKLKARLCIMLIGERPGLSSPNSMGIYLTYEAMRGKTDEARNCISNIREGGLSIEQGVQKLSYLVEQAFIQKRSGVALKDMMPANYLPFEAIPRLTQ